MYLLFDIGGTHMRFAALNEDMIFDPVIVDTPQEFESAKATIQEVINDITAGQKIEAGAGGVAGAFNEVNSFLVNSPHLPKWTNKPLKEMLQELFKAPVFLENDTSMVGLGEATAGAGVEYDNIVYLTISTGFGGTRIVNKRIDINVFGFEPGHQIINYEYNNYSGISNIQTLESVVSGSAIKAQYGKTPMELRDKLDWQYLEQVAAIGIHNSILHWSPEAVILGGGLMHELNVSNIKKFLKDYMKIFPSIPEIKQASLGDIGGLYGAKYYLNNLNRS